MTEFQRRKPGDLEEERETEGWEAMVTPTLSKAQGSGDLFLSFCSALC